MRIDPAVKEQARELRRQGLSVAQIAVELGGIPTSTVHGWMVGVPPPEWTRRPRAKDAARVEARRLRAEGRSNGEIADRLGVSKSSVSLWARDLEHPEPRREGDAARREGHRRYYERRRRLSAQVREGEIEAVATVVGRPSLRELLVAGAVAYWAEGSKSKPWRPLDRVTFINSDVDMIRLFLAFLGAMGVTQDQLRFRVSIHETADESEARSFWAGVVGVTASSFQRSTLKKHVATTVRRNVGAGYHGCLVIGVLRSATLYREIEGIWRAVTRTPSNLVLPSRVV